MTDQQWIELFQEAYKFPFREDIRIDEWKNRDFTKSEIDFLLSESKRTTEYSDIEREHMLEISEMFTRYFFKKALNGETFCSLEELKKDFRGKSFEQLYGFSSGPFINLAKTYWTFRHQLNEDTFGPKKTNLRFYQILRYVETNIAGAFFPSGGAVSKENQINILKEFAPEINIERFLSENPLLSRKVGCFGGLIFLSFLILILILVGA